MEEMLIDESKEAFKAEFNLTFLESYFSKNSIE